MEKNLIHVCITNIDKLLLKIDRKIYKSYLKFFAKNKRPSSYPYVTGDSFRALADHIHDETSTINPDNVKNKEVLFVGQSQLPDFFTNIHPKIRYPYILICHNGDSPQIDKDFIINIDDKIIHFFAQDVLVNHPKITPIPIGLANQHYHLNGVTKLFDRLRKKISVKSPQRKNKFFYNFSVSTNPTERGLALKYFDKHPLSETAIDFLSARMHSYKLMTYKFVISPPGNSIESCRTWEALYLFTVPIVKDYECFLFFKKIGLPIWTVKDWSELDNLTETDLARQYDKLMTEADFSALHMDYWIKLIEQKKNP